MKYKTPRQIIRQDIVKIISREIRKQNWVISRASKNNLKEIAEVSKAIRLEGLPKNLVCKKLGNKLGYGIFLHPQADPIVRGQLIAPYSGVISIVPNNDPEDGSYAFTPVEGMALTRKEQKLFDEKSSFRPRRHYCLKVDARKNGNFTRFINHSAKPNVEARTFYIPKNLYGLAPSPVEILYLATKTILPGQQLLLCYEAEEKCYWIDPKIKPVPMTPTTYQLDSKLRFK